jgi:hypothetical protein
VLVEGSKYAYLYGHVEDAQAAHGQQQVRMGVVQTALAEARRALGWRCVWPHGHQA